jgi:alpha-L-rhamnosidase
MGSLLLWLAAAVAQAAPPVHMALDLRVEHAAAPLTVDVAAPRFSWQPSHPLRAQHQASFRVEVRVGEQADDPVVWDSGTVASNHTRVLYAGATALVSDTDYTWSVVWTDAAGDVSQPAHSTFSTALLREGDWRGAAWLSSSRNGSLNLYRSSTLLLDHPPLRARLFIAGLGYYHATINGMATDEHMLGPQSTFHVRALYDVWDVTALLHKGCNVMGVAVGGGWGANTHHKHTGGPPWDRQFIALLSVTHANGTVSRFATATAAGRNDPAPTDRLLFTAGAGPVTHDDVFDGEAYDGRVAAALSGWDTCSPAAAAVAKWEPCIQPRDSPADHGAQLSAHTLQTRVIRDYSVATGGGITEPLPGTFVFKFPQNMAGVVTLRVRDCISGNDSSLL